jgi:hypothetical protein
MQTLFPPHPGPLIGSQVSPFVQLWQMGQRMAQQRPEGLSPQTPLAHSLSAAQMALLGNRHTPRAQICVLFGQESKSGSPSSLTHRPSSPKVLHCSHSPSQVALQQTPSAQ